MKKNILNPNVCIDMIENFIANKKDWEILEKKYDFYQPYLSTYDNLNYDAKIDFYIKFKTKNNYIHKMYFYFLDFDTDNVFKVSDIKSSDNPQGQVTTRVADFKYYKTTGNLGFTAYKSPKTEKEYNISYVYHNLFNALNESDLEEEISYVCVILKYHNHARNKKRGRYYVNSFKNFIKRWLGKIEKFEVKKARLIIKAEKKKLKQKEKKEKKLTKEFEKLKNISNKKSANKINKTDIVEIIELEPEKVIKESNITVVEIIEPEPEKVVKKSNTIVAENIKPAKKKVKTTKLKKADNSNKRVVKEGDTTAIYDDKNRTVKIVKNKK